MLYEKTGLKLELDIDPNNKWQDIFDLTRERTVFLSSKVTIAFSTIVIHESIKQGVEIFMSECNTPNEAAFCWFIFGRLIK